MVIALLGVWVAPKFWSGPRPEGVPYGVKLIPGKNAFGTQDFACHINYLQSIWNRSVEHPYRLEDQERIVRSWYPRNSMEFPHAYSPVVLVLGSPFLAMKVEWAFFLWALINAGLLLALTWGYLLPRIKNPTQGFAIMAVFCSYLLLDIFNMGQTALATTTLYAGSFLLLRDRSACHPVQLSRDLVLFAALYALAAKPSIALIVFAMVIGQRAWRPLLLAMSGLLFTWAILAPYYGGYVAGLTDYSWLLNHFCSADMIPIFRGGLTPSISTNFTAFVTTLRPEWNREAFFLSQIIFEGLVVLLTLLRWSKRISFSTQFQGLLWTLLLFCPYLLVTEDFAICLLAVEGTFFRNGLGGAVKVLLVLLAANIWIGASLGWPLSFALKFVLAIWWLLELVLASRRGIQGVRNPGP